MGSIGNLEQLRDAILDENSFSYRVRPVPARVTSVNPENDTMAVDGYAGSGTHTMGVLHPYMTANSWIRTYPEPHNSVVMIHEQAGQPNYVPMSYFHASIDSTRRNSATALIPTGNYRKMRTGEIELSSSGQAQLYLSKRGDVEVRAGLVRTNMSMDRMEIKSRAPTHIREMSGKTDYLLPLLGDEERFGLVKRATPGAPPPLTKYGILGAPYPSFVGTAPVWPKEYMRVINTRAAPMTPSIIPVCDYREGTVVIDNMGAPDLIPILTVPPVPGPFRFRGKQYVVPGVGFLDYGMNQLGSVGVSLPASPGASLNVTVPSGGINLQSSLTTTLTSTGGVTMTSPAPFVVAGAPIMLNTPGAGVPVAKLGDIVMINLAVLAPLILDSTGNPCKPASPATPAGNIQGPGNPTVLV